MDFEQFEIVGYKQDGSPILKGRKYVEYVDEKWTPPQPPTIEESEAQYQEIKKWYPYINHQATLTDEDRKGGAEIRAAAERLDEECNYSEQSREWDVR